VKKFTELALTFAFASCSAAYVAYSAAYIAHYELGIPSAALRNQALTSAILILGLVTIEFLASKKQ
jgi:hypothetical protein